MQLDEKILAYIEAHSEEAYELLVTLGRIPAPSKEEGRRAGYVLEWLQARGAHRAYIDSVGNVVCPFGNCGKGSPLTVFLAHSDIVFDDRDELPMRICGDRIYCPGIGDDTANAAAMLFAASYLLKMDLQPKEGGVLVVFNVCEEGLGNLRGTRQIMADFGADVKEVISFDSWNGVIDNAAIGSRRWRICADTKGGHSYKDFGAPNAIVILAGLIGRCYAIDLPEDVTINVGTICGGTTVNSIAEHAEMLFEFRAKYKESADYMQKQLDAVFSEDMHVSAELVGDRPMMGKVDAAGMHRLEERQALIHEAAFGSRPVFKASSTDCNIPLSMGIPAICVGCFNGGGSHTREEYVETDSLKPGYQVAFATMLAYF